MISLAANEKENCSRSLPGLSTGTSNHVDGSIQGSLTDHTDTVSSQMATCFSDAMMMSCLFIVVWGLYYYYKYFYPKINFVRSNTKLMSPILLCYPFMGDLLSLASASVHKNKNSLGKISSYFYFQ